MRSASARRAARSSPRRRSGSATFSRTDSRGKSERPLCSGGLPSYRGLDLARSDWPSTRLAPGASLTMAYGSTIPHTGTFKLFLTRQGYDPTRALTWSDLPAKPFAQVTDPPLVKGAHRIGVKLPADRTGHHVLYTICQNSSTTDTYYSCSDVVFPASGASGAPGGSGTPNTSGTPGTADASGASDTGGTPAQPPAVPDDPATTL
ncbi:lytic polysaccharide monooxygenase, partial [Streptomyces caeni]